MTYYESGHNVRAWLPLEKIAPAARNQIDELAKVPGLYEKIAIMPDVHLGFGMPIGGVAALDGYIIPNAVGVDIGCGVLAIATTLVSKLIKGKVKNILTTFLDAIPVGFRKREKPLTSPIWQNLPDSPVLKREQTNARRQLGTLGGGNHFIELQRDEDDYVWLMLHSGSRNLGKQVANHYHRLAQTNLKKKGISHPPGLAWLELDSPSGREYFRAMEFCTRFATENRRLMAEHCLNILADTFDFEIREQIETVHNYAALETHMGKELIVHRKGAVRAQGKVAIPGSMGSASFIGHGLENPLSFRSCSHGAGRVLGRREAKKVLNRKQVLTDLKARNIVLITPDKGTLVEEAREAYKDIEEVMLYQKELVKPLVRLAPLGVLKG